MDNIQEVISTKFKPPDDYFSSYQVLSPMITHVFLPRKLPMAQEEDIANIQGNLLAIVLDVIEEFKRELPGSCHSLFKNWFNLQKNSGLNSVNLVSDSIRSLGKGEMLAFYLGAQNGGIILSRPLIEDHAIISTFKSSMANELVVSSPGDIVASFPQQSIKIPFTNLLKSKAFAQHLTDLHKLEISLAMPTSRKAGHDVTEIRDVSETIFVSEWLTASLSDEDSSPCTDIPTIVKKIRDDVLWRNSEFPFRRSGFWMTIKVVLQLNLKKELGPLDGKLMYKLLMASLMTRMCEYWHNVSSINIDLSLHMLAKLARRLEKLKEYIKEVETEHLIPLYQNITEKASKVIEKVRKLMDKKFHTIYEMDVNEKKLQPLYGLNFDQDIFQTVPTLQKYLSDRREKDDKPQNGNIRSNPKYFVRHRQVAFPLVDILNNVNIQDEIPAGFVLTDVENWIHTQIEKSDGSADKIRQLAFAYSTKAKNYYKDDPIGSSRMLFTLLQIIYVVEKMTIKKYPELKEHRCGLNSEMFHRLLLRERWELISASKMESYFSERDKNAYFPSLIEEDEATVNSFGSRYASSNTEMMKLKKQILENTEMAIQKKYEELRIERESLARWRREYNSITHNKIYDRYGNSYCYDCTKCRLDSNIKNCKVDVYERTLRHEPHCQNAVVFELLIPLEVACLRDLLHLFVFDFCRKSTNSVKIAGIWTSHPELSWKNRWQVRVQLGSTAKRFADSHYRSHHPDQSDGTFIVNCAYNCTFFGSGNTTLSRNVHEDSIRYLCTFKVQSQSPYNNMDWALKITKNYSNNSLAKQSDCHKDLSLSEYVEFGSLRSGHRLQIRNIYRALVTARLSFKNSSVVSLILQSLWEAGPNENHAKWYRESHEDFIEPIFTSKMVEEMQNFVRSQQKNWKEPNNLLIIILTTVRILELNSTAKVIDEAIHLLIECRNIAQEWILKIEDVISKCNLSKDSTDNDKTVSMDEDNKIDKEIAELRSTLIDVAICCSLTFSLSPKSEFFSRVLNTSTMNAWLASVVKTDNNINLSAGESKTNIEQRNFLRLVRHVGINIEIPLATLIDGNCRELNQFAQLQWNGAENGIFDSWKLEESPGERVCYTQLRDTNKTPHWIQMDLILGKFLVDGKPVSRLSDDILHHQQFIRIFGGTIFEVQPTEDRFCTISKYSGCSYFFSISGYNIIVTEQNNDGEISELIPHEKLAKEIPFLLVENFSHWLMVNKNCINFRPKNFQSNLFASPEGIDYIFDINSKLLAETKSSRNVVDITKSRFKTVALFLSRVELSKYILVLATKTTNKLKIEIELPRLALQFQLDESGQMVSREYKDMKICVNPNLKVFLGLKSGIILEDCDSTSGNDKIFLVPHGTILSTRTPSDGHQNVEVCIEKLREPPFFVYEIDERFCYLKAGKNYSAWFYLAHLHAITSYPLPDPFTGMTGTERALQILQSGYCWSSEPFDSESIETMEQISKLSPIRKYYPAHLRNMQVIYWPANVFSSAAHESYSLIIEKLMKDSMRLKFLFHNEDEKSYTKDKIPKNILGEKAYWRYLSYNPNSALAENFQAILQLKNGSYTTFQSSGYSQSRLENARILGCLGHSWKYIVPEKSHGILIQRLINGNDKSLNGVSHRGFLENDVNSWLNLDFRKHWLNLYNFARNVSSLGAESQSQWILLLSLLAYLDIPVNELLIIHTVAVNTNYFADICPPTYDSYDNPKQQSLDSSEIVSIFRSNCTTEDQFLSQKGYGSRSYYSDADRSRIRELRDEYTIQLNSEATKLTAELNSMWPCNYCHSRNFRSSVSIVQVDSAISKINPLLRSWYANRELGLFLNDLSAKLNELRLIQNGSKYFRRDEWVNTIPEWPPKIKYEINYTEKMSQQFDGGRSLNVEQSLDEAEEIFKSKRPNGHQNVHSKEFWGILVDHIVPHDENYLVDAGLYPRIVPSIVLPMILLQYSTISRKMQRLVHLVGCIGTLLSLEKQKARISKFKKGGDRFKVALDNEILALSTVEWSRAEHPSWLLIELEMNITIRMVQIKVANQMIRSDSHSVLQLNMGEGKTAVIVPLLASLLADGKQLCRVTVLKSLYRTNLGALRQCLGGMLNRRIYTVPCRRDRKMGVVEAKMIFESYQECFTNRGIVMTLPEYRLSFQLKMYETARQSKFEISQILMEIHNWLNANARDILDESDEILHAKYQLIYTVGEQLLPGGGTLRWTVIQDLLKLVPIQMKKLREKFGFQKVEFDEECADKNGPQIFWPCRLLSKEVFVELIEILADKFLAGGTDIQFPQLAENHREIIKRFLIRTDITQAEHSEAVNMFKDKPLLRDTVLILAGYLKYEVLYLALTKRWRVNYGVNILGRRNMAVPFKAKDVAAEMTEFGHPDVAICLTQLSYYYSGLNSEQLLQTFELLAKLPNADTEYENWISKVPPNEIHDSIRIYSGINLKDSSQREIHLFPVLKKNMYVIDFWLNNIVFPREAKQFAGKMMCTAWDLVSENQQKTVTGFSGTNDSKLLLPLPIQQRDLPELEKTNEEVRDTLLRSENDDYLALEPNVKSISILEKLSEKNIQVLLDPGALMLELNNYQVASEWLKIVQNKYPNRGIKAAVYFDLRNILMVTDGVNRPRELELSPFRESLEKCVTYLDDVHTRGTDLKFPPGTKACVTLSGDITRDKTVQACMRMRMLGKGHTICFWSSQEADNKIRKFCEKSWAVGDILKEKLSCVGNVGLITNKNVVDWICENSRDFEKEGLVHWSAAGYNYAKKRAAHERFGDSCPEEDLLKLSERCSDKEIFELMYIYGEFKNEEKLTTIIRKRFTDLSVENSQIETENVDKATVDKMINGTMQSILDRVEEYIPDKKRFIQLLDEEQEKELENETEEERQVSRPGNATPILPKIDPAVTNMINSGHNSLALLRSLIKLPFVLENTSLWKKAQTEGWGNCIFATKDFMSVIKPEAKHDKVDEFLRPVSWIANVRRSSGDSSQNILILLSPFEADHFIPIFWASKFSTLHMFASRLHPKHDNLLNTHQLQIPAREERNQQFIDGNLESQLTVFSGTLYFGNKREQDDYCNFAGLIPGPRSTIHQKAYDKGQISSTGFLYPEYRSEVSKEVEEFCRFLNCPDELIRRLAEQRHQLFPKTCHVASIVVESKKPFRE